MHRRTIAVLAVLGAAVASAQTSAAENPGQVTGEGRPARRPDLRRLFVSPMGEPFRDGEHPEPVWFAGVDANHDGRQSRTEFIADAMRFFAMRDFDHNRAIGPAEIDCYEQAILPEIGDGPRGGPPGGGRRGGGFPVAAWAAAAGGQQAEVPPAGAAIWSARPAPVASAISPRRSAHGGGYRSQPMRDGQGVCRGGGAALCLTRMATG